MDFADFSQNAESGRVLIHMFTLNATFVGRTTSRRSARVFSGRSGAPILVRSLFVAAILLSGSIRATAQGALPDLLPGTSFRFTASIDRITKEDTSFVVTTTREFPIQSLACKCLSDGLNVLYSFGEPLAGRGATIRVRMRFPGRPATRWETWGLMVGKRIAYMPENDVVAFIDEASRHPSVTLQAMGSTKMLTAVFSIGGIDEAVRRLDCYQNLPVTNLAIR